MAKASAADSQFESNEILRRRYRSSALTDAGSHLAIVDYLMRKDTVGADLDDRSAGRPDGNLLFGAVAAFPGRYAHGLATFAKEYDIAAKDNRKSRAPAYATLALMGAINAGQRFREPGSLWIPAPASASVGVSG